MKKSFPRPGGALLLRTAVCFLACATSPSQAAPPVTDGLVAQYDFTGNANDSANSHHGTVVGAVPAPDRFGRAGHAYFFNGTSAYIEIPDHDVFSVTTTGAFSLSVWVRPDGTSLDANGDLLFADTEGTGYVHWLGKGESNAQEWAARIYSANNTDSPNRKNRTSFYVFNANGARGTGSYVQEKLTPGAWIHYVATVNTATKMVTWYKNGLQVDQDYYGPEATDPVEPQNGSSPFRIGTRQFQSYFAGAIDDLRVYDRVLPIADVQKLFQETTTAFGNWQLAHDLAGAATGPDADADGDGVRNLLEYAFGMDPTIHSETPLPVPFRETVGDADYLALHWTRLTDRTDLAYAVEVSTDLTAWTPIASSTSGQPPTGAGFVGETGSGNVRTVHVRDTAPFPDSGRRFLRISVTQN
jgi:hypothetical protein